MLTSKNMYTTIFLRSISFKKKWKAFENKHPVLLPVQILQTKLIAYSILSFPIFFRVTIRNYGEDDT